MFTRLFEESVSEGKEDDLWSQCARALREARASSTVQDVSIQDVDRLVLLVSHSILDEYKDLIQITIADTVNGFVDDLPF